MQFLNQRPGSCLADLASQVGRLAADLSFDVIERADALDSLGCDRGAGGNLNVIQLAPDVGPASRFVNPAVLIQMM